MSISLYENQSNLIQSFEGKVSKYLNEKRRLYKIKFFSKRNQGKPIKLLNFFMKIASLELKKKKSDQEVKMNSLKCINPFLKRPSNQEMKPISRIFYIFIYIFATYGAIKLLFLAMFNFLRDYQWKQTRRAFNGDTCSLQSSFNQTSSWAFDYFGYKPLTNIMKLSGALATATLGTPSVAYATLGSGLLFSFNISILLVYFNHYRVDVLYFLRNPVEESMRIHRQMTEIMVSILEYLVSRDDLLPSGSSKSASNNHRGGRRVFTDDVVEYSTKMKLKQLEKSELLEDLSTIDCSIDQEDDDGNVDSVKNFNLPRRGRLHCLIFYEKIFIDILDYSLVQPVVLTKEWHNWLLNYSSKIITLTCLIKFIYCNLDCLWLFFVEVDARLKQRLLHIQCSISSSSSSSSSNSTIFKLEHRRDFHQVEPLSLYDIDYFIEFLNSGETTTEDYLKLFLIESLYYLTFEMISNWLVVIILCTLLTSHVSFYFCLHSLSHLDRITWINQIIGQIDQCINSIIKLSNSLNYVTDDVKYQLSRDITITYLNYELFIRQQKSFQKLSSFLVYQGGPCLVVMPLTYLIAINIKTDSIFMLISITTFVVVYMNFYLLHTAFLTNKIEKLRKNILRLLANGQMSPYLLDNSHILNLWRQHAATQAEYGQLYSPKFFGFHLSYDKLFTLDIYFIILIIIIVGADKAMI